MFRGNVHIQIATINVNMTFMGRSVQLHKAYRCFDTNFMVLQGIAFVKRLKNYDTMQLLFYEWKSKGKS